MQGVELVLLRLICKRDLILVGGLRLLLRLRARELVERIGVAGGIICGGDAVGGAPVMAACCACV